MKDRVDSILDMIGLERNTVQTLEGEGDTHTLYFPNFMTSTQVRSWTKDSDLLDIMISAMEEHAMDVAKAIKMAKRYRKSFHE
jgi:nitrogen regulatory protein PII